MEDKETKTDPWEGWTAVDLDDIKTYPPEKEPILVHIKRPEWLPDDVGVWDRFFGERRGSVVYADLYDLIYPVSEVAHWQKRNLDALQKRRRQEILMERGW